MRACRFSSVRSESRPVNASASDVGVRLDDRLDRDLPEVVASTSARSRSSQSSRRTPRRSREAFAGRAPDLTEENLQARIRGMLLMALSNKFGCHVVHHRQQVGAGGRLRDALRRHGRRLRADQGRLQDAVFRLCALLNERAGHELIPERSSTARPRAELRADQLDEDSLPPYPSSTRSSRRTWSSTARVRRCAGGFDPDVVERAHGDDRPHRVQAPPGSARREAPPEAFGRDRRPPITDRWPG